MWTQPARSQPGGDGLSVRSILIAVKLSSLSCVVSSLLYSSVRLGFICTALLTTDVVRTQLYRNISTYVPWRLIEPLITTPITYCAS